MARDVGLDVGHRELHHLSPWSFVWFNTFVKSTLDDQGQGQVLVVNPAKLRLGDHDLLFVFVGVAADVELLGLL